MAREGHVKGKLHLKGYVLDYNRIRPRRLRHSGCISAQTRLQYEACNLGSPLRLPVTAYHRQRSHLRTPEISKSKVSIAGTLWRYDSPGIQGFVCLFSK